jgi:hypothetical protein
MFLPDLIAIIYGIYIVKIQLIRCYIRDDD